MRRAVFLDRDGVLNRVVMRDGRPFPPSGPQDVELVPGALGGCRTLHRAGFLLIVVTNQPDVARGTQQRETVEAINRTLSTRLPLDDVRVCYHDDRDKCLCRKPAPGMLLDAATQWGVALNRSFMIGDRWQDIEAGRRAGCRTVFLHYGQIDQQRAHADFRAVSFREATDWILACPDEPGEA